MSGTKTGGLLAAKTNKARHGENFYKELGSRGGKKSRTGGFYNDPERASKLGTLGGAKSRRGVDEQIFINVWQSSANYDEAAERLKMKKSSMCSRASILRRRGFELKYMRSAR